MPLAQQINARLSTPLPCYFPSLPLNTSGTQPFSLRTQAEALYHHMLSTDICHWHVVGYSLGGRVAQALAYDVLRYQHILQVHSLSLLAAHPGLPATDPIARAARVAQDSQLAERLAALVTPLQWRHFFDDFWYALPLFGHLKMHAGYEALLQRRTQYRHAEEGTRWAAFLLQASSGKQRDYRQDLLNAAYPVHYLAGAEDVKYKGLGESLLSLAQQQTHFSFQCLAEAAHMLYFEQPVACAQYLADRVNVLLSRFGT